MPRSSLPLPAPVPQPRSLSPCLQRRAPRCRALSPPSPPTQPSCHRGATRPWLPPPCALAPLRSLLRPGTRGETARTQGRKGKRKRKRERRREEGRRILASGEQRGERGALG